MRRVKARRKARKINRLEPTVAPPSYVLEPLDPWAMCGPDTSVTELWKVKERLGRETRYHLVYFDRYGWYCEHGRSCAAVSEVRRVVRMMSANAPNPRLSGTAGAKTRK